MPFPVHQKMQLEAVSRGIRALGSAFPAHTEPAPNPQGHGEVGAGSSCSILAKINQPIWICQLGPLVLFSVGVQEA